MRNGAQRMTAGPLVTRCVAATDERVLPRRIGFALVRCCGRLRARFSIVVDSGFHLGEDFGRHGFHLMIGLGVLGGFS
jgi:hypothetical protein